VIGRSILVTCFGRGGDGTREKVVIAGGRNWTFTSGGGRGGGVGGVVGGVTSWVMRSWSGAFGGGVVGSLGSIESSESDVSSFSRTPYKFGVSKNKVFLISEVRESSHGTKVPSVKSSG